MATCPAHLNLLDLITLILLGERYNYEVPHCGTFSTPHSHPSWAQIFALGSCFKIPLVFISPLMKDPMFHNHIAQLAIILFYVF